MDQYADFIMTVTILTAGTLGHALRRSPPGKFKSLVPKHWRFKLGEENDHLFIQIFYSSILQVN